MGCSGRVGSTKERVNPGREGRTRLFGDVMPDVGPSVNLGPRKEGLPAKEGRLGAEGGIGHAPAKQDGAGPKAISMRPQGAKPGPFPRQAPGERPTGVTSDGAVEGIGVNVDPGSLVPTVATQGEGHNHPRERIEPFDQDAPDGGAYEPGKELDERPIRERPRPRIRQYQAANGCRMPEGVGQSNGSTPVVQDERDLVEGEVTEELFDEGGVRRGTIGEVGRGG